MAQDEKIIIDVQLNYAVLAKQSDDIKNKITALKEAQVELNKQLEAAKLSGNAEDVEKYNTALFENAAQTKAAVKEQKEYERQGVLIAQSDNAKVGSITQLRKNLSLAVKDYADLSEAERNSAKGQEMLKNLEGQQTSLKKLESAYGDNRRNVGNYTEGILAASAAGGKFNGTLGSLGQSLQQVKGAGSALNQVWHVTKSAANSAGETFTKFTTQAKEGLGSIKTGDTAKGLETIGNAGKTAFLTIGRAILLSGIGLILIPIALLVNHLRTLDPIVDKFEQGMAAVGEVIRVVSKGIYDVITGAKSLSEFFGGVTEEATKAANAAIKLKQAQQDLEDKAAESILTQKELSIEAQKQRKLSEDKTLSDKQRLDALKLANEAEKQGLKELMELEAERTRIAEEEFKRTDKSTKSAEEVAAFNEQKAKLLQAQADYNDKDLQANAENSKIRNQQYQEDASARINLLKEDFRIQEFYGGQTLELKKKIAKGELDAVLNDSDASNESRKAAQEKYNNDLLILQSEHDNKMREARKAASEKLFSDQQTQADEEIAFEERRQNALLEIQKANAGTGISEQFLLRLDEINKGITSESAAKEKARQDAVLKNEQDAAKEIEQLSKDELFKAKTVEEKEKIIADIYQKSSDRELEINSVTELEKLAILQKGASDIADATQANDELKLQKIIEQKQLENEALGGSDGQSKLDNDKAILDAQMEQELSVAGLTAEQKLLIEQKYANKKKDLDDAVNQQRFDAVSQTLGNTAALFKKETAAYKIFATAQAVMDTYKAATSAYASLAGIPVVGPVLGGIAAGVAVATGLANIAKIGGVQFAHGGYTGEGTPGVDDRAILVSGKEYVLGPAATKAIGVNNLNRINFSQHPSRFATGGLTSTSGSAFISNTISQPVFEQDQTERLIAAIHSIPRTAVVIEDINAVQASKARVDSGANI